MRLSPALGCLLGAFVLLSACSDGGSPSVVPVCDAGCTDAAARLGLDAGSIAVGLPDAWSPGADAQQPSIADSAASADSGRPAVVGPGTVVSEPVDEASYVFDQTALRTYNVVIAPADLATIDADPAAEQYVPASLEFEGKTYGPLSVRYKGSIGAFLSPCTYATFVDQTPGPKTGKCSIKVDFNSAMPDLRFYGLKKLNFHAMGQDPSQLRDRLAYAMYRENGVAAPRAVHARVLINGKLEGLYVVVEEVDGRFAKQHFTEGGQGNLYKEVWPIYDDAPKYQAALETNKTTAVVDKMIAFKHAIDQGAQAMSAFIDRDYTFKYLAVDRLIINDDGALHWYCQGSFGPPEPFWNHNYYWYEAQNAQRFWLIPWDLDGTFAGSAFVTLSPAWNTQSLCICLGNPAQRPTMCDPLTAEWASSGAEYAAAVDSFVAGPFSASNVDAKLNAWLSQITPVVQESAGLNGAPSEFTFQSAVSTLRSVVNDARTNRGR